MRYEEEENYNQPSDASFYAFLGGVTILVLSFFYLLASYSDKAEQLAEKIRDNQVFEAHS